MIVIVLPLVPHPFTIHSFGFYEIGKHLGIKVTPDLCFSTCNIFLSFLVKYSKQTGTIFPSLKSLGTLFALYFLCMLLLSLHKNI